MAALMNSFLYETRDEHDKQVFVDKEHSKKFDSIVRNIEETDYFKGYPDSTFLTDEQDQNLAFVENASHMTKLNRVGTVSVCLANVNQNIVSAHTPDRFVDCLIMYNETIVQMFFVGALKEKMLKIFRESVDGVRKYMMFVNFEKPAVEKTSMNLLKFMLLYELRKKLKQNNEHLTNQNFAAFVKPKAIILEYRFKLQHIVVGEVKVIMSPEYIFYRSKDFGMNFWLRLLVYDSYSDETTKNPNVTLVPVQIMCVNKAIYDCIQKTPEAAELMMNQENIPDTIIAVPKSRSYEKIFVRLQTSNDVIRSDFFVTSGKNLRIIRERNEVKIGFKIFESPTSIEKQASFFIEKIYQSVVQNSTMGSILLQSVDALDRKDSHEVRDFKLLNRLVAANVNVCGGYAYPLPTTLDLYDFKASVGSTDIASVLNHFWEPGYHVPKEKNDVVTGLLPRGYLFLDDVTTRAQVWMDVYSPLRDKIMTDLHKAWLEMMSRLSNGARRAAEELNQRKTVVDVPSGMTEDVFKAIVFPNADRKNLNRIETITKIMRIWVYNEHMKSIVTHNTSYMDNFLIPFEINASFEVKIGEDPLYQKIYREEKAHYDIGPLIHRICVNVKSLMMMRRIPVNVMLHKVYAEVDEREFMGMISQAEFSEGPTAISTASYVDYIKFGLRVIDLFKNSHSHYVNQMEIEYEEEVKVQSAPESSSSEAQTSSAPMPKTQIVQKRVNLFSVKNFNGIFEK